MKVSNSPLLSVKELVKYFPVKRSMFSRSVKFLKAVDGVSFEVWQGENIAIVGESGCGKTTLGRMLCGIIPPTKGTIEYEGEPMSKVDKKQFVSVVQPIFQDPYSALNPVMNVRQILSKPFKLHDIDFNDETLCSLLEQVGLSPPRSFLKRYPHQLSGGQRQRIVIARALALNPKLAVCDEPVSGLDPTVQILILNLLRKFQQMYRTTYLIISHDIRLVKSICQRTMVMYLGKIVEVGPTGDVLQRPFHPYTKSLLQSFPSRDPDDTSWVDNPPIFGDVPSAIDPPSGCGFRTRCPLAVEECALKNPTLTTCGPNHYVACHVVLDGLKVGGSH
ncbi:MAG: ABC transporter ATP-binding protein [Nitrososphaeria archaeon]